MTRHHHWIAAAVFFVPIGLVCSGSALGGEFDASGADEDAVVIEQLFGSDGAAETETEDEGVSVSAFDTVSLNVQNTDLADVLQVLSVQGKRNIVPSPSVSGSVTANLYDVTFYEALDAILQQNGCGYREKGNFIYIYTMDELAKLEQAERKLEHKVVTLNYITATDASTFITPLLSSAGSVAVSGDVGPGFQPSMAEGGADSFAHAHTMVIRDYAENIAEVEKVLAQIDTRPMQVMVEATILQADVNDNTEFGVDFSILVDEALDAVSKIDPVGALIGGGIEGTAIQHNVPQAANGTFKVGVVTNNVAAFISALDKVTDTTIVANPKILVLNRQKAEVLVGNKLGYLSTTSTSTATTQTVEFLDTGTQLTVRPFVSNDGYIRLELKPQISDGTTRDVAGGGGAVTIPDEETQELITNVIVRDGQTVVMGGLFKEKTEISRDQIPGLGSLPLVGAAFKGRDDALQRTEVIFLVTPNIVRDEALFAAGKATRDGVEMVRIGAREGLLPWSRSKMTAAHVRDALKALEAGDRAAALWEVDAALGLDPKQLEAIRLKEKLTGQRAYWPGTSLLDDAVDLMVERKTGERRFRARPMVPDPRRAQPASDGEPLTDWNGARPSDGQARTTEPAAEPTVAPVIRAEVEAMDSNAGVEPVEPLSINEPQRAQEIGPAVDAALITVDPPVDTADTTAPDESTEPADAAEPVEETVETTESTESTEATEPVEPATEQAATEAEAPDEAVSEATEPDEADLEAEAEADAMFESASQEIGYTEPASTEQPTDAQAEVDQPEADASMSEPEATQALIESTPDSFEVEMAVPTDADAADAAAETGDDTAEAEPTAEPAPETLAENEEK